MNYVVFFNSYLPHGSPSNNSKGSRRNLYLTFNKVSDGDLISVHYAGILAGNANLFDSSIEYVWDNYEYRKTGVSDSNKHTATLGACLKNSGECPDGYSPMIAGFTEKTKTMYEGQTLSVRIPAKDAYGVDPSMHDLGGEDLIFEIVIVSID